MNSTRIRINCLRLRSRSGQRGAALVETAIALTVLTLLVFGIIEMGLLFRDEGAVANAARECARGVAAGDAYGAAQTRGRAATPGLDSNSVTFTCYYSTDNGATFATQYTDTATSPNSIPPASLFKVTAIYTHHYVTSVVIGHTSVIQVPQVMRREN